MRRAIPMTRRALRAEIPQRIIALLLQWFDNRSQPYPRALVRAGYRRLPGKWSGVEREVVVGPRVVIKTRGWRDISPAASRFRRARTLAPTIELSPTVVVQPLGRVVGRMKTDERDKIETKLARAERIVEACYSIGDTHDWNFALFPDGTVRHLDY